MCVRFAENLVTFTVIVNKLSNIKLT